MTGSANKRGLRRWFRRKNWNEHVADMRALADSDGFVQLRERIVELAAPEAGDRVLDVGSGTGLLTVAIAPRVAHVSALDISSAMSRHLSERLQRDGLLNVDVLTGSAAELPLADESVDLVVSNYCYHHLADADKIRALADAHRVLRPGGRLVVGDMMFRIGVVNARDRTVIVTKVWSMLKRGPAGIVRLAKNAARYLAGRWEEPAGAQWWEDALAGAGFESISVQTLDHEGGIAVARRSARAAAPEARDAAPQTSAPRS